jgi:hypothetical protein
LNQLAAVMYAPTARGTNFGRRRTQPQIVAKQSFAMNSLTNCAAPDR